MSFNLWALVSPLYRCVPADLSVVCRSNRENGPKSLLYYKCTDLLDNIIVAVSKMQSCASKILSLFNAKADWKHSYWELNPGELDTGINLDNLQEGDG